MTERAPTLDEQAGMDWWNSITEPERADWLRKGSATAAQAWQAFKDAQQYAYFVAPRPVALGGGWRLRLVEDGQEVGGGVFPPVDGIEDAKEATEAAYSDALDAGEDWLSSRAD